MGLGMSLNQVHLPIVSILKLISLIYMSIVALVTPSILYHPPWLSGLLRPRRSSHLRQKAWLGSVCGFYAGERKEYVKLIVRQLRGGKLELRASYRGGGTILPVSKSRGRQRIVWHGKRISAAAAVPPPPRHLVCPSVLALISLDDVEQLRVTKRECRFWFDQLLLSQELPPFMARPWISKKELVAGGLTEVEIQKHHLAYTTSAEQSGFYPLPRTCPIVFSKASYVAQEAFLSIISSRGLTSQHVLAPDATMPSSLNLAFVLATDDLMIFPDAGFVRTLKAAQEIEIEMETCGV